MLSLQRLSQAFCLDSQEPYEQALECLATLESLARNQQWWALLDYLDTVSLPDAAHRSAVSLPVRTLWEQVLLRQGQAQRALGLA